MHGKLDRRLWRVNFPGVLLYATSVLLLFTAGCFLPTGVVTDVGAGAWAGPLGNVDRTPFLTERVPLDPVIQWESRYGRGYTDVPYVTDGLIIASSTAKTATVANATTGKRIWERRLNGPVVGALLRRDERLYAVTQSRDGRIEALSVQRGRHAWTVKLGAPASGGAALVDSVIYAGTIRSDLFAIGIATGLRRWRVRIPAPLATTPLPYGGDLFIITGTDSLLRVDRASGQVTPGLRLSGSASSSMALHGDRMLVALHPGNVVAVHLPDMRVEWTARIGAPILAVPAVDTNGDIYVLTSTAEVWRIDPRGAATRVADLGGTAAESLSLTADGLLIGKLDGTAMFIRRDGTRVWERSFVHSVRTPIAVRAGSVYIPFGDGRMVMLK